MTTFGDIQKAYDAGRYQICPFRKLAPTLTGGVWSDLSYSAGIPTANYYASAPLVFAKMGAYDGLHLGTYCNKVLHKVTMQNIAASGAPMTMMLLDYIMYAPFVDFDSTDPQYFTPLALPRYTTGEGLQMMLVGQGTGTSASTSITISYTNSKGVAGRTVTTNINTTVNASQLNQANNNAFLGLQAGDSGIGSIESITVAAPSGGIGALVIVKPIATVQIYEITAPHESDFFIDYPSMPFIDADAYLHFIARPVTSHTPNITGNLEFIW